MTVKNNVQNQNKLFRLEYEKLVAEGINGLTLITAEDLLGHDHEGTVDGSHPNDLGFERMVEVIQAIITPIINQAVENGASNDVAEESEDYTVSTTAGGGSTGDIIGNGLDARFKYVQCLATDSKDNIICSDRGNHKIKRITPDGIVSIVAGTTVGYKDGNALTEAQFYNPYGIAIDNDDNIYVADQSNHKIRKISPAGIVSTIAGSSAGFSNGDALTTARFNLPVGIIIDHQNNLIISDCGNHCIRKISGGIVSTIAGGGGISGYQDGSGSKALFNSPTHGIIYPGGDFLISDSKNQCIRRVSPSGVVTTFAGKPCSDGDINGDALTEAKFSTPSGIAIDLNGNVLIADKSNHKIRVMGLDGKVATLAGSGFMSWKDGHASSAEFNEPSGIAINNAGDIFIGETTGSRIRKITKSSGSPIFKVEKEPNVDLFVKYIPETGIEITIGNPITKGMKISLYGSTGKLLKTISHPISDNKEQSIFIPVRLSEGVYILRFVSNNYNKNIKFVR